VPAKELAITPILREAIGTWLGQNRAVKLSRVVHRERKKARQALACRERPVLIVALAKRFGGADVRVIQMARALHGRRRYAVAVLPGSPLKRRLEALGLNVVAMRYARFDPRNLVALYRLIVDGGYEVVDAHNPQSQLWGLWAAHLAVTPRKIWTVHSDYRMADGGGWKAYLLHTMLRAGRRWDCRFIAVSQVIASHLVALGTPADRVQLSLNAIEMPQDFCGRAQLVKNHAGRTAVIAVVARLDPMKGHRVLLQALHRLQSARSDFRCIVIGDGPERGPLEAEVARLGLGAVVQFVGFRDDVPTCLASADLFCLPSLTEGLPFAVLEAALMFVPLLLTSVGELPMHFEHGTTARLIPPGNVNALEAELIWFLDHRAEAAELALRAERMVRQRFCVTRMITETLATYDQA
jgi:glycosyltransferase involved in cell wall biosynthesis